MSLREFRFQWNFRYNSVHEVTLPFARIDAGQTLTHEEVAARLEQTLINRPVVDLAADRAVGRRLRPDAARLAQGLGHPLRLGFAFGRRCRTYPPDSSVAQRQSIRLLTGGLLVRIQPEEPTSLTKYGTSVSAESPSGPLCPFLALFLLSLPFGVVVG